MTGIACFRSRGVKDQHGSADPAPNAPATLPTPIDLVCLPSHLSTLSDRELDGEATRANRTASVDLHAWLGGAGFPRRIRFGGSRSPAGLLVLAVWLSVGTPARAQTAAPAPSTAVVTTQRDLPPLPSAPRIELPTPGKAALEDVDSRLQSVVTADDQARHEGARQLLEVDASLLPAIASRLGTLAETADREKMKRALQRHRDKGDKADKGDKGQGDKGDKGDSAADTTDTPQNDQTGTADLLVQLVDSPSLNDPGWRQLTTLIALSRMLTQLGTVEAAREQIGIYARFGEFVRIDVQRQLSRMGDSGVAALIEARRHRAAKIASWAERQLDRLGKSLPGAAIRTDNVQGLADILRALGRTRDPDAARLIVTFANSERYQIREASRQAIALLGDVGIWQLREAYENAVGKRSPREFTWERTARELFAAHDRIRLAQVQRAFEEGQNAYRRSAFEDMARSYDAVLIRSPNFDEAGKMASGYLAFAESVAERDPKAAHLALVRAERIATDESIAKRARSLRGTLEARTLLASGTADLDLLRTALALDPSNRLARRDLQGLSAEAVESGISTTRLVAILAIAVLAVLGIATVFFLPRRSRSARRPEPDAPATPPDEGHAIRAPEPPPPVAPAPAVPAASTASIADETMGIRLAPPKPPSSPGDGSPPTPTP